MSDKPVTRSVECQCGGRWYYKTSDWNGEEMVPVWECPNCFAKTPRQSRSARVDQVTPTQAHVIERIRAKGENNGFETELLATGRVMVSGHLRRSDAPEDTIWTTHVVLIIGRKGALRGEVRGTMSDERILKSSDDFWMIYR